MVEPPAIRPLPVKPLLGILLKVLSALVFTMMSASLKLVSARYPTGELVFSGRASPSSLSSGSAGKAT